MVRRLLISSVASLRRFFIRARFRPTLVVTSVTRSLKVAATGGPPDMDVTTTTGTYLNGLSTTGVSPAGTVTSDAIQASERRRTLVSSMSGIGTVASTATADRRNGLQRRWRNPFLM